MSDLVKQIQEMNDVNELRIKGYNPTQIAKQLGMSRGKVLDYIDQWATWAREQQDVLQRARESLDNIQEHYNIIIKRLWETVEDAELNGERSLKAKTLVDIAKIEKDRAALFQQAGLNDSSALAADMAEQDRRNKVIEGIIREVVLQCNHCKIEVAKRLSELNNQATVIQVSPQEITA